MLEINNQNPRIAFSAPKVKTFAPCSAKISAALPRDSVSFTGGNGSFFAKLIPDFFKKEECHDNKKIIVPLSKQDKMRFLECFLANNNVKAQKVLKTYDFEQHGKSGVPLIYPREKFLTDLDDSVKGLSPKDAKKVLGYFNITRDENDFEGIPVLKPNNTKFSSKMNEASKKLSNHIKQFLYENSVDIKDKDAKETLNALLKGIPEFTSIIGKKQHATHKNTVDVHTLAVLQKSINDPLYKELTDNEKTILKMSVLIHDMGKKCKTVDKGHERLSADYAVEILSKYNFSPVAKERITDTILSHHWFGAYNKNQVSASETAAMFKRPGDFKIAKIFAKADLTSINDTAHIEWMFANDTKDFEEKFEKRTSEILQKLQI